MINRDSMRLGRGYCRGDLVEVSNPEQCIDQILYYLDHAVRSSNGYGLGVIEQNALKFYLLRLTEMRNG